MASPKLNATASSAYRYLVVGLLSLAFTLNFVDRTILSVLIEPIKRDLNLTDLHMGILSGLVFAVFYAIFGIPIAYFADRWNRVRILACACAAWSIFTATCGLANNFVQLAVARVGVGVGEAGCSPPSYSLIADYFPPQQRAGAISLYALGVPLGTAAGSIVGAAVAAVYGWRAAFAAVGLPGVLVALLIFFVIREPIRGGLDDSALETPVGNSAGAVRWFLRSPLLCTLAIAGAASTFVGTAMVTWIPALLLRSKGMSLRDVGLYYGAVSGLAAFVGTLTSGYISDYFGVRSRSAYALLPGLAFLISMPLFLAGIWSSSWRVSLAFLIIPFAVYASYLAPTMSLVTSAVHPSQRSRAAAIFLLTINTLGTAMGPLCVGWLSGLFHYRWGVNSLAAAMTFLMPAFLLASAAFLLAARQISRE